MFSHTVLMSTGFFLIFPVNFYCERFTNKILEADSKMGVRLGWELKKKILIKVSQKNSKPLLSVSFDLLDTS